MFFLTKRKLYRNVDGRIVILFMPLKWNFVIFLCTSLVFVFILFGIRALVLSHSAPAIETSNSIEELQNSDNDKEAEKKKNNSVFTLLMVSVLFISANFCLNAEFKFRESGLQYIKNYLRYQREGKIIYERSLRNVGLSERFFRNKIKRQFK